MQELSRFSATNRRAGSNADNCPREHELGQLAEMAPGHLWRLDPHGEATFSNRRMADYLGPGAFSGRLAFIDAVHPDEQPAYREGLERSLATGRPFSLRHRLRRHDGSHRWMSSRAEQVRDEAGAVQYWYGLSLDIDDQVRAEEAAPHSEAQLRQIVDTVPVAIWSFTSEGQVTYVSPQNREHLGVTDLRFEDFATLSAQVVHPDDRPLTLVARTEAFRTGRAFSVRYRRRVNGAYRWTEGRAAPVRDATGNVVHWYAVSMDVDDEVRALEALRESEERLRGLVDALPTQIWAAGPDGEPSYLNRRLSEFVGLTLDDLDISEANRLQAAIDGSVHPDDRPAVDEALRHAFATGEPFAMKYRQRRADGVYRWITGRAEPLRDADGIIRQWYGVSFDIDDDVRTQEELRRTQERLATASQAASLAELSASVAHEVNQPLAAVVANSYASQRWLAADPPNFERAQAAVERVVRDANGAAEVLGRIRALFKQSRAGRALTHLEGVIDEARALLAEEAALRRIRIEVAVQPHLPPASIDRVQVQQVLINLMRNGMEAMAAGSGDRLLTLSARLGNGSVRIEVGDRGPGIEQVERMFEPFFTTKEHGMGMGLAICRSIVESHGGRLWAERNEPQGARLCFTLPVGTSNE